MKSDMDINVRELKEMVLRFVRERNWEKFHNPKNLAEAICIESAELLEIFQWASTEEVSCWRNMPSKVKRIREELADVFIYCISLANIVGIDIAKAVLVKLKKNVKKYPIEEYKGRAY
jgi:NTP pyrophosphatase (non-canonical NTP hydrolase)